MPVRGIRWHACVRTWQRDLTKAYFDMFAGYGATVALLRSGATMLMLAQRLQRTGLKIGAAPLGVAQTCATRKTQARTNRAALRRRLKMRGGAHLSSRCGADRWGDGASHSCRGNGFDGDCQVLCRTCVSAGCEDTRTTDCGVATVALQRGVASASMLGWPSETAGDKWETTTWAAVKCPRKGDDGRGSSRVAQACAKTQNAGMHDVCGTAEKA
eukprot:719865-Pleurochrysis_carterae.AAC.1